LGELPYDAGSGSNEVWARAFDGFQWSAWESFHINTPADSGPPSITTPNLAIGLNEVVQASSLFTASDHPGAQIQNYEFWDTASGTGAHFAIAGTPVTGFNHNIDVAATQLNQVSFVGGSSPGMDTLWMRANDGVEWSSWQSFTVTTHT
jgi:hypothetical protein